MNKKELKKAFDEGLINEDTFKEELFKLETLEKIDKKPSRIFERVSEEDFIAILKHTKKREHLLAFVLAYGAGLRISEIVGKESSGEEIVSKLDPNDINLKEKKIFIRQAKGMKDRITYCPKWIKQSDLKYFPLNSGRRAIQTAFLRNSLKAGVNRIIGHYERNGKQVPIYRYHFHCLRSSFITNCLDKGVPVHQVQILVGHSNLATTSKYAKASPTDAISSLIERGL